MLHIISEEENKMKQIKLYITALLAGLALSACQINDPYNHYYHDNVPPSPPEGISILNGDQRVDLTWIHNPESDVAGYNVYYSYDYSGKYTLLGSTKQNWFIDNGASNGVTYYYGVAAYDYNGNESELSYDYVYATPRPEGFNQAIFDYLRYPDNSGYTFNDYSVVPFDGQETDFFFENYNGTYYLNVWDDTDIQNVGPTNDIYDVPFAPTSGWSTSKDVMAKIGHTYVIWTWDNHFAKIRVKNITRDRIVFDWAFQLVEGNRELKPRAGTGVRKNINKNIERIR
jgi:hypothetical protein